MVLKQQYFNIGKCIYCGTTDTPLTKEHVIPLSLKGEMILGKASCDSCRAITSKYERNPIRDNWMEARACLDYPSRKTNFSEKVFPLKVILKDGTETTLELNKSETLGIAHFPEFPLPAFFGSDTYKSGAVWNALRTIGFGKISPDDFSKKYNVKQITGTVTYKGNHFEIMIVRIAYCAVVAYLGPDSLARNYVLPTILGKVDDVGYWLGTDYEGKTIPHIGKVNSANVIRIGLMTKQDGSTYLLVTIKFFAASDAPEYVVVVGEPTEKAIASLRNTKG